MQFCLKKSRWMETTLIDSRWDRHRDIQLCEWRCWSGWLPWRLSARTLQEETKEGSFYALKTIRPALRYPRLRGYCEQARNLGCPGAVSSGNLWAAAHNVESFGLVLTCGAAGSGCHILPGSERIQTKLLKKPAQAFSLWGACRYKTWCWADLDLYVLGDVLEGGRAFVPDPHQLHGVVKVPDVIGVHS